MSAPDLGKGRDDLVFPGEDLGEENVAAAQVIEGKGIADDFGIAGEEQFGSLFQDIGDHQHGNVILLFFADFFQRRNKLVFLAEERVSLIFLKIVSADLVVCSFVIVLVI